MEERWNQNLSAEKNSMAAPAGGLFDRAMPCLTTGLGAAQSTDWRVERRLLLTTLNQE
jgi:hypothetical protein